MKQAMEGLTPLQMDEMEKGRLTLEEAQEMANLIVTKLDGFDFKKIEAKDYEEAMEAVEKIIRFAEGEQATLEGVIEYVKNNFAFVNIYAFLLAQLTFFHDKWPENIQAPMSLAQLAGSTFLLYKLVKSVKNRTFQLGISGTEKAKEELSELKQKTKQRLEAEKKYQQQ